MVADVWFVMRSDGTPWCCSCGAVVDAINVDHNLEFEVGGVVNVLGPPKMTIRCHGRVWQGWRDADGDLHEIARGVAIDHWRLPKPAVTLPIEVTLTVLTGQAIQIQNLHLEALAHAFRQAVGCPVEEVELVQRTTATEVRWFYRRRTR